MLSAQGSEPAETELESANSPGCNSASAPTMPMNGRLAARGNRLTLQAKFYRERIVASRLPMQPSASSQHRPGKYACNWRLTSGASSALAANCAVILCGNPSNSKAIGS
jgi:hypothetical protein